MTTDRWCRRHQKIHGPDELGALCRAWDEVEPPPARSIPWWRWRRWFPVHKLRGDS